MATDDKLQAVLKGIADGSAGRLSFKAGSATQVAQQLGLPLTRSTNPIYLFAVDEGGERKNFVAFTLSLDGRGRPATRAEALGASLAATDGKLFELNPLLLVYDNVGERILAVSAIELFSAFAELAATRPIPYSKSSSFSLSPSFQNGTISMYAELRPPTVWATSAKEGELNATDFVNFLSKVATETSSKSSRIPQVVEAVRDRINATEAAAGAGQSASTGVSLAPATPAVGTAYVSLSEEDEAVQVEERLWGMLVSAVASSPATLLVGPPGTGKSALVRKAIANLSESRMSEGADGIKPPLWATPDDSWTSRELIGGETIAGGEVVFRAGWVLKAIAEGRWLVLDEANRGDLDRIFGALLTWLSGGSVAVGVESTADDAKHIELGWTKGPCRIEVDEGVKGQRRGAIRYLAGDDWRLLGTYNALDSQRVFRLGAALGRRFVRVPIPPIAPALFRDVAFAKMSGVPKPLVSRIIALYAAHYEDEATCLGPALFLGMSGYLRSALGRRGVAEPDGSAESAATAASSDGVSQSSVGELELGEVLAEAYVLNVGTHLAQLEEPDFANLMARIKSSSALTEDETKWVSGMMKALA
jgi:MoxR-like ATPase